MIDTFGAREGFPLKTTFLRILSTEAEQFVGFLLNAERVLPIVFLSRRNSDSGVSCDPSEVADKLAGIAYVCLADGVPLSWALAEHIDNRLNTYDGGVRIYWPRMTPSDSPFRHRLWTRQSIEFLDNKKRTIADELLSMISAASVTRRLPGLLRWDDVERETTRQTLQRLRTPTDAVTLVPTDEWLNQYQMDLTKLEASQKTLDQLTETLRERDEELRNWKQMYVQLLRSSKATAVDPAAPQEMIEDAESAITTAATDFPDRLEILEGRIDKDASQFEEPELLYAALKWLASVYWDSKVGIQKCDNLDKSCREACQFRYVGHQSEITMGMYASDYEVTYRDRKVKLREHLGYGSSTEPRHTIRIAFFFDKEAQRVVIGYIGQHQATRKSN